MIIATSVLLEWYSDKRGGTAGEFVASGGIFCADLSFAAVLDQDLVGRFLV